MTSPVDGMRWAHAHQYKIDHARCEHCQPLRSDTNVLVLARLTTLTKLSDVNLFLSLLSIMYLAVNVVMLVVTLRAIVGGEHLVDGGVFHTLDFGSAFCFALVEVLTLVYSPERRFSSPLLLKVLMFTNMGSTFMGFLFIVLNRSAFESLSHNIDYVNELSMALIDSILVSTIVLKATEGTGSGANSFNGNAVTLKAATAAVAEREWCDCILSNPRLAVAAATLFPIAMSSTQLVVYNGFGVDARGHVLGELAAHVLEFLFNGMGATITFWFCLDSKFLADQLARQIMLAPPRPGDSIGIDIDPPPYSRGPSRDEREAALEAAALQRAYYEHNHFEYSPPGNGAHQYKRVPRFHPSGVAAPATSHLSEFLLPDTLASAPPTLPFQQQCRPTCGQGDCEECSRNSAEWGVHGRKSAR